MSTEIEDQSISSRPISIPDIDDLKNLQDRVEKIDLAIQNLEKLADALNYDERWQTICMELNKRLLGITRSFFTRTNPSDPHLSVKYATAWGQFSEILQLTERQIGVKNEIEIEKNKRMSVMERIEKLINLFKKQNEE